MPRIEPMPIISVAIDGADGITKWKVKNKMSTLDVLTYGFGLATDQGSVGYSTNALLRVWENKTF
ncbi:MAG: hypothetical protein Ct9H300mP11_14520 [Chloroflexota bacterium]|nr:MAG: hypothetical protein Ct9H300mP11_14520 [Chloroflexota bacterium]